MTATADAMPEQETANSSLRIIELHRNADGVLTLRLADPEGHPLPTWEPGAHIEVVLPSGKRRQYSLCGRIRDTSSYTIAVLRERDGRGGSEEIHTAIDQGDELRFSGPRNQFPLQDAPAYLFVAGGIGITPMLPMIEAAKARGKPWRLVYGGRTRRSMAFVDRVLEHADADQVRIWPEDEVGMLDLDQILATAPMDAAVYCCGPTGLIEAMEAKCIAAERGPLHSERFSGGGVTVDGVTKEATGFTVELRQSGIELEVPADTSILDAVREVVPDVPYSCEEGWCGSCETDVVEGEPLHRDTVLTPDLQSEGSSMMICVSRCKGARLVLDL